MGEEVNISVQVSPQQSWRIPYSPSELEQALRSMWLEFRRLNPALPHGGFLELAVLSDAEIACLNQDFLGCPAPTNILAFPSESSSSPYPTHERTEASGAFLPEACKAVPPPLVSMPEMPASKRMLGWLALSGETMSREALLFKQPLGEYTLRLLAHGLAHLFDYEHGDEMDDASARAAVASRPGAGGYSSC